MSTSDDFKIETDKLISKLSEAALEERDASGHVDIDCTSSVRMKAALQRIQKMMNSGKIIIISTPSGKSDLIRMFESARYARRERENIPTLVFYDEYSDMQKREDQMIKKLQEIAVQSIRPNLTPDVSIDLPELKKPKYDKYNWFRQFEKRKRNG